VAADDDDEEDEEDYGALEEEEEGSLGEWDTNDTHALKLKLPKRGTFGGGRADGVTSPQSTMVGRGGPALSASLGTASRGRKDSTEHGAPPGVGYAVDPEAAYVARMRAMGRSRRSGQDLHDEELDEEVPTLTLTLTQNLTLTLTLTLTLNLNGFPKSCEPDVATCTYRCLTVMAIPTTKPMTMSSTKRLISTRMMKRHIIYIHIHSPIFHF